MSRIKKLTGSRCFQANPRTTAIRAVAKANNLEIDYVDIDFENISEEHKAANKLGKIPTFIGADGYTLTECIAIAIYSTF